METTKIKSKALGAVLLAMAVIGIAIIIFRIAFYQFEFDPKHSPIDYGRFNVITYFTIQSNFFACIYFISVAFGIFGSKKLQKFAYNPTLGALVTLYVIVAGLTYNAGFPIGMTPPLTFDTPYHCFISFMQCYYHMAMPVAVLLLWLFPLSREKLGAKCVLLSGIYPLVYSIISIVRGAYTKPTYYPYPFYNPEFIWQIFMKDKPMNTAAAYVLIAVLLVFGISLFMAICSILVAVHNKRIKMFVEN